MPQPLTCIVQIALGLFLATATISADAAQTVQVTNSIEALNVNGVQRTYALERFHVDAARGRLPIIIYLHGINGDVTQPETPVFSLPFDTLPDSEPALIVRPQGIDRTWNAPAGGQTTGRRAFLKRLLGIQHAPADDVSFLRQLIAVLVTRDHGDPQRVYVAGVSAGGYMTARVACELDDVVAAVAILAASARSVTLDHCQGRRPIPVLLMASTTDPTVPYRGSDLDASAPDTVWFFKNRNGCTLRTERLLPHLDTNVNSTASLIAFTECKDDADVLFYRVDGSGHNLPSPTASEPADEVASQSTNRDIDTPQVVWDFFRNRKLAQN